VIFQQIISDFSPDHINAGKAPVHTPFLPPITYHRQIPIMICRRYNISGSSHGKGTQDLPFPQGSGNSDPE
jgi:hypothetical protein